MADVLTDKLTVTVGGEQYVFKIPSPMEQIEIGVKAAALRRRHDFTGGGWEEGLDQASFMLVRGIVVLQVLLRQSSAKWPYSESRDDKGAVTVSVDPDKFPPNVTPTIIQVYQGFSEALARFFTGGAESGDTAGAETVAGQPNP